MKNLLYDTDMGDYTVSVYEINNLDIIVLFQSPDVSGEKIFSPGDAEYSAIKRGDLSFLSKVTQV